MVLGRQYRPSKTGFAGPSQCNTVEASEVQGEVGADGVGK